jgi:sugar O-acyltransferase (sialic acid O-acetyltransferase NeuD family)
MNSIIVVGGGGHAKVVISILRKLKSYRILGYTDLKDNGVILGAAYLGTDGKLEPWSPGREKLNAVLGIGQVGTGKRRDEIWIGLKPLSLDFPLIVSPAAVVNEGVTIGEAGVVMDGAVINSGASLGRGVIVNTNSTIEHDVVIGDWVHVGPGVTISGGTTVGRYSMVGAGATVIEGINIAEGCMIGAGATVVHDLTESGVYVGCPARLVR